MLLIHATGQSLSGTGKERGREEREREGGGGAALAGTREYKQSDRGR